MKMKYQITVGLFCVLGMGGMSCEEQGILVNDNSVSYLRFAKNMTTDTTTVSVARCRRMICLLL